MDFEVFVRLHFDALGVIFLRRFKICFKKRSPARVKQGAIPLPGGSRTGSHYQELFEQETIVRTHVEAIVRVFV